MQPHIVLLDSATLGDVALSSIAALGHLVSYERTLPGEVAERIAEAEIIITNKVFIGRQEMEAAPHLRLICIAATGTNNVDLEEAERRQIAVRNVAGYSTESVVQTTFAHLLSLMGRLPYYDRYVKQGDYSRSGLFTHHGRSFGELAGKRMGIVGLGTIGRRVAEVAEAFGMEVVYYATSGRPHDDHFQAVSFDELLTLSDVISIHAPLNERTRNLFDRTALDRMKPSAILLNAGRGGIVDEAALAEALNKKSLLGAGLDVYQGEPLDAASPLLAIDNPESLSLTPHTAWASIEARERLVAGIVANIKKGY